MSYTISVKKRERGKAGYRQMLVRATVEQKTEISRRQDLYNKDYNKETVTKDEHAEIVFHILKEFRVKDQK